MSEVISYVIFIILIIIVWQVATRITKNDFERNELKEFALNITGVFILRVSFENKILEVNSAFLMHTNYEEDEVINVLNFSDLVAEESKTKYKDFLSKIYARGSSETEIFLVAKDKKHLFIQLTAKAFKDKTGYMYYIFVCKDISDLSNIDKENSDIRILNRELASSEIMIDKNFQSSSYDFDKIEELKSRHRSIFDSINIGMLEYDVIEKKLYLSDKCREIFSISKEKTNIQAKDIIIKKIYEEDYYKTLKIIFNAVSNKSESFRSTFRIIEKDKSFRWIEFYGKFTHDLDGNFIHLAGSLNDITSSYIYQERIKKLAYFDTLTGLRNRFSMEEIINNYLKNNKDSSSAFIFLDIDDFKYINDSFGIAFGDEVIKEMANRVLDISPDYLVGRFAGDEMAIFIYDYKNLDEISDYIKKLTSTIGISYIDEEISYSISASIGISLYPGHGNDFEELLTTAEIAMSDAKAGGKNGYIIFSEEIYSVFKERLLLEKELRKAISNYEELEMYLQPQFDLKSGNLCSFEALVRWNSESRGYVPPDLFIPIAEETRLIAPIGKWALLEACKTLKTLEEKGYPDIKISVNLSPIQLLDATLISSVKNIIDKTKINPENLEIEITETALMESFDSNIKKLYELRDLGISIALDDFGTGYSSFKYLKDLPIKTLKIDKSFIDNITVSYVDRQITQKIIDLAHILNLRTIAEGVETAMQLEVVSEIGCDMIQGYLGGKPVAQSEIFSLLNTKLTEKI